MTTTTHQRSVHIDAPVEKVFDHVKDPRNFYDAMAAAEQGSRDSWTDIRMTPEGVGSTYAWSGSMLGFHVKGVITREEYVPNERIVDHSSTGPVWTWTFQADPTGTNVTLAFEYSTKVPLMDKVIDRVGWNGDRDLDTMLAHIKQAVET